MAQFPVFLSAVAVNFTAPVFNEVEAISSLAQVVLQLDEIEEGSQGSSNTGFIVGVTVGCAAVIFATVALAGLLIVCRVYRNGR